jgi:hypothetical protein
MRQTLAISLLVAVSTASIVKYKVDNAKTLARDAWPKVQLPKSFNYTGGVFTFNSTTKKLDIFSDTVFTQSVDAESNRALINVSTTIPTVGHIQFYEHFDFTTGKVTVKNALMCQQQDIQLPTKIDLVELFKVMFDPNGGMTTYNGETTVEWTDKTYHSFQVKIE